MEEESSFAGSGETRDELYKYESAVPLAVLSIVRK